MGLDMYFYRVTDGEEEYRNEILYLRKEFRILQWLEDNICEIGNCETIELDVSVIDRLINTISITQRQGTDKAISRNFPIFDEYPVSVLGCDDYVWETLGYIKDSLEKELRFYDSVEDKSKIHYEFMAWW